MPKTPEEIRTYQREWKRAWRVNNRARHNANAAAWNARNPEKKKASDRNYVARNHAKKLAYMQQYYLTNKVALNQKSRAYWDTHKAACKRINTLYRLQHAAHLKEQRHRWEEAHKEALALYQQAYRRAHPEKGQQNKQQRRAQKAAAPRNDLTQAQWQEIKDAFDHRCAYCGRQMQRLTQDHITPLSKHGDHHLHNIIPACVSCNSQKHTGPPLKPVQPLLLTIAAPKKRRAS